MLLLFLVVVVVVAVVIVLLVLVVVLVLLMVTAVVVVAVVVLLVFVEVVVLLDVGIKCGSPRSILPSFHRSASFFPPARPEVPQPSHQTSVSPSEPNSGGGEEVEEKRNTSQKVAQKKGHSEFLTFFTHGCF